MPSAIFLQVASRRGEGRQVGVQICRWVLGWLASLGACKGKLDLIPAHRHSVGALLGDSSFFRCTRMAGMTYTAGREDDGGMAEQAPGKLGG